jgi:leucyl aminopeptidase
LTRQPYGLHFRHRPPRRHGGQGRQYAASAQRPGTLCDRVLLVGLGKEKEFHEKEFANAMRTAVKTLNETGAVRSIDLPDRTPVKKRSVAWRVRQAAMIALDATYRFEQFKSKKDEVRRPLRKLTLGVERRNELALAEEALAQGIAIAEGTALTKDLGNLPPNVCHPAYLAEQAQAMAKEFKLGCEILERPTWKNSACTPCCRSPAAPTSRPS